MTQELPGPQRRLRRVVPGGLFARPWAVKLLWPLAALALLLLFNLIATENFFRLRWQDGNLFGVPIDILKNGSIVMLVALGMTLVIATGGVDLSIGGVMAISGAVSVVLIEKHGCSVPTAAGIAIGVSLLAGAWNGLLVALCRVQPLVATLILMVAGRGIAQLIAKDEKVTLKAHPAANEVFAVLGNGFLFYLPFAVTIVVAMTLLTALLTRKTALGMFIEAVGDNDTASRYAGVSARVTKFSVYVFSGFCAGVAGLIYASNILTADFHNAGLFVELDAIMAVVIGGTALTGGRFYLIGSVVGGLLIQTLTTTMFMLNVRTERTHVPKALVVVGVCLLQSARFRQLLGRALRASTGRLRRHVT